jgi:hypothetical protein
VHFIAIVMLVIGWTILLVATWNSLNTLGVILTLALLGGFVWFFIEQGWVRADSPDVIAWILLVCIAGTLAVGLSWAHGWRRLTGQVAVDEIDD